MKKIISILLSVAAYQVAAAAEVTVEITGNDQMQYNVKSFEVTEGDTVTVSFKHIGQLPVVAMGHNLAIVKPGTELPMFSAKAASAKDSGFIPQEAESKDLIVAHTKMLGGGESDTITFTAPAPGDYPYLCTFPGHFAIMQGVMKVKAK